MELMEICEERRKLNIKYMEMMKDKLIELCRECGLYDVDVFLGKKRGRLVVEKKQYCDEYEVNFYHYTQKGELSKNATTTGVYIWSYNSDEQVKKKLLEGYSLKGSE